MSGNTKGSSGHEPTLPLILGAFISLTVISLVIGAYFEPTFRTQLMSMKELIASIGVIGAALITYDGATSKTRLDRSIHEEQMERRRLNLFLKAEQAVATITDELASQMGHWWLDNLNDGQESEGEDDHDYFRQTRQVGTYQIQLNRPQWMESLWDDLAVFPQPIISSFRNLEKQIKQTQSDIERVKACATSIDNPSQHIVPVELYKRLFAEFGMLYDLSKVLLTQISDEIPIKGLSEDEYLYLLYGEPE